MKLKYLIEWFKLLVQPKRLQRILHLEAKDRWVRYREWLLKYMFRFAYRYPEIMPFYDRIDPRFTFNYQPSEEEKHRLDSIVPRYP